MADGAFWRGKTVLVTGATGFLGGYLVRDLLAAGARVIGLQRRDRPDSQLALEGLDRKIETVRGDVWDKELLEVAFARFAPDAIFHTAMWGGGVEATLKAPIECLRSTVESTWLLLDLIRRTRPGAVMIVCSSDKAYGNQQPPYREEMPLCPEHPQEVAKASQDLLTQSFGKVYGLNVAVTRCGNFYGPYDFNFTRIIPYVARCCAEGVAPELRSDGSFIRDYLAIEEASKAHLMLAEALGSRPELRGEVFNFSHEVQMTVMDIVHRILKEAGSQLTPRLNITARHEIPSMWLDCGKSRRLLGWTPGVSFEDGLAAAVRWYLAQYAKPA